MISPREAARAALARDGFFVLLRGDTAATGFTVGLSPAHPELVVIGPPPAATDALLHAAAQRVRTGERLVADTLVPGLWPGGEVAIVAVGARHLPEIAPELAVHPGIELVQLVVPDPAGRFPWDTGCDVRIRLVQPVLESKDRRCRWSCDVTE